MAYDAVVIGSGAGGGTIAWALARAGKKTLILERGQTLSQPDWLQDEATMLIQRKVHERELFINGREERLFTSGVAGGGTSLYGAALLRPSPDDFRPGKHYPSLLDKHLWDWPLSYDELEPYYAQAEDLYHVSADHQEAFPHLGRRAQAYPGNLPALEPINVHLTRKLKGQGVTPFHLPLAIDFKRCLRCPSCPGYGCPNGSRASSLNRCIEPAVQNYGAELQIDTEAIELLRSGNGNIASVRVMERNTGVTREIKARRFVVAAGAIGSPVLLQRSGIGNESGQLGRNYMYHAGALAVGLYPRSTGGADRFIKQLGWTDDYFGTEEFPHKLGYVQALPIPGPLSVQAEAPVPIPLSLAEKVHEHAVSFAATVEDLPLPGNRVQLRAGGKVALHHRFHSYDKLRMDYAAGRLKKLLKGAGAWGVVAVTGDKDDLHTAHQVGTARFGRDPKHSVLDRNCRVHGSDNLFVVDGSFFPTSLGVGPALTIIANALRVADAMIREEV